MIISVKLNVKHFFIPLRHPSLSDKVSAPRLLTALDFQLDSTHSLDLVLGAAMPGNRYEFLSVGAMTLSMGNSDAVRLTTKQHPNVRKQIYIILNILISVSCHWNLCCG